MASRIRLWAAPLLVLAAGAAVVPSVQADPLTPLTPNEIQYLDHARQVFSVSHDPVSFRGDGELLLYGHFACDKRRAGFVGADATKLSPVISQLAFIHLCPE